MSIEYEPIAPVPTQTRRVALAAFPKGNPYLTLRDELGPIFSDLDFVGLFSKTGKPAVPPWQLALVTRSAVPGKSLRPTSRRRSALAD
jgi:transposase